MLTGEKYFDGKHDILFRERTVIGKDGELEVVKNLPNNRIVDNQYDAKDDRMNGNPNQMNIQSMYSDIDLDANGMETEFQASFEELFWFINMHLFNVGLGDFEGEEVEIIFNRDMKLNEGEVIDNISKSSGIISDETLIAQHPWVDDPQAELERLEAQKQANMEQYTGGNLASFVYERDHVVKQINVDRVVITFNNIVIAAVKKSDLTLVE